MEIGLIIFIIIVWGGIFGSIFIATLIYNLNYYKETKNENLRLRIKLKELDNKGGSKETRLLHAKQNVKQYKKDIKKGGF